MPELDLRPVSSCDLAHGRPGPARHGRACPWARTSPPPRPVHEQHLGLRGCRSATPGSPRRGPVEGRVTIGSLLTRQTPRCYGSAPCRDVAARRVAADASRSAPPGGRAGARPSACRGDAAPSRRLVAATRTTSRRRTRSSRSPSSVDVRTRRDLDEHLDPAVEVAVHQVGGPDPGLRLAAVLEPEDPAVLEEPAEDAADPDVLGQPGTPGRSAQMPRAQSSTGTPACDAR